MGFLNSQQIVIDTDPTRVDGHGSINLRDETVDMTLARQAQAFPAPASARAHHAVRQAGLACDRRGQQAGSWPRARIGRGLGLLSPFAAILAFVDPGLAKDANCAGDPGRLPEARARRSKHPR